MTKCTQHQLTFNEARRSKAGTKRISVAEHLNQTAPNEKLYRFEKFERTYDNDITRGHAPRKKHLLLYRITADQAAHRKNRVTYCCRGIAVRSWCKWRHVWAVVHERMWVQVVIVHQLLLVLLNIRHLACSRCENDGIQHKQTKQQRRGMIDLMVTCNI